MLASGPTEPLAVYVLFALANTRTPLFLHRENKWDFVLFLPSLSSDDAHVDALRRPTGRVKRRRSRSRGQPTLLADQFEGEGLVEEEAGMKD